jgi:hypothetical protein
MKLIYAFLLLISLKAEANSFASCDLVNGVYRNSSEPLTDLRFETLADIFTMNNANALFMVLDSEPIRLLRSEMIVSRQTRMIYLLRKNGKAVRAVHMMIDRTPKKVSRTREFYGNMIISEQTHDAQAVINSRSLVYNFYCRF